jgi:hypothetical protein
MIGTVANYRIVGVTGNEAVDLTAQYKFDFTGLVFSSGSWKQLYWQSSDGLRRLDLDSQSVSGVLAVNVIQIWSIPDRVLYVQQTDIGRSLWSLDSRGKRQQLVAALVQSPAYSVAYSNYRGQDLLAVVPASTGTGTLYTAIFSDTSTAKVVAHNVVDAGFSPDGHLAVFSSPIAIVTTDLERLALTTRSVIYQITDQPGTLTHLDWLDSYHMLVVRSGRLYVSEFDGTNRVDLGEVTTGQPAYGSADGHTAVINQDGNGSSEVLSLVLR